MLALLRLEKYMYFDNYSLSEATAHALIRLKLRLLLLLYLLFSAKKKNMFFLTHPYSKYKSCWICIQFFSNNSVELSCGFSYSGKRWLPGMEIPKLVRVHRQN